MNQIPTRSNKTVRGLSAGRPRICAPVLPKLIPSSGLTIEKQVYRSLRYALMTGSIAPGAALTTRSLSTALGVSSTPVREALKRLDADGAVVSRSKSAFFVNDPNQIEFSEILEIRLNLEGLAIRNAAERATDKNLEPIHALNQEYQAVTATGYNVIVESLRVNFRFHFEMYKLSGSDQLVKMIETLWLRIGPALHHYMPEQDGRKVQEFHNQMVEALVNRDAVAAENAVILDLTTAANSIIPLLPAAPTH